MRSFKPKIIAIASVLAAMPLSGAYAAHHRVHHDISVDTWAVTSSVPMDIKARAAFEQLQGVREGIVEAREVNRITADQAHSLMRQANAIQHVAARSGFRSVLGQVNDLDQQLQVDTGEGIYIGGGADGGYYPHG